MLNMTLEKFGIAADRFGITKLEGYEYHLIELLHEQRDVDWEPRLLQDVVIILDILTAHRECEVLIDTNHPRMLKLAERLARGGVAVFNSAEGWLHAHNRHSPEQQRAS